MDALFEPASIRVSPQSAIPDGMIPIADVEFGVMVGLLFRGVPYKPDADGVLRMLAAGLGGDMVVGFVEDRGRRQAMRHSMGEMVPRGGARVVTKEGRTYVEGPGHISLEPTNRYDWPYTAVSGTVVKHGRRRE